MVAFVEVLQVQFIGKVVDVLMQLKFQQSRLCTGFIDRVLLIVVDNSCCAAENR